MDIYFTLAVAVAFIALVGSSVLWNQNRQLKQQLIQTTKALEESNNAQGKMIEMFQRAMDEERKRNKEDKS